MLPLISPSLEMVEVIILRLLLVYLRNGRTKMADIKREYIKFVIVKCMSPNPVSACRIWASKTAVFTCVDCIL